MAKLPLRFAAGPAPDNCWVLGVQMPPSGLLRDLTPLHVYSQLVIASQWGPMRRIVYPVCGSGLAPHNVALLLPDGQVRHDMNGPGNPSIFADIREWLEALRRL